MHPQAPVALLDSSDHARTACSERSQRGILAFSLGEFFADVYHRDGVTCKTTIIGEYARALPFFDWLRRNWNIVEEDSAFPQTLISESICKYMRVD